MTASETDIQKLLDKQMEISTERRYRQKSTDSHAKRKETRWNISCLFAIFDHYCMTAINFGNTLNPRYALFVSTKLSH